MRWHVVVCVCICMHTHVYVPVIFLRDKELDTEDVIQGARNITRPSLFLCLPFVNKIII